MFPCLPLLFSHSHLRIKPLNRIHNTNSYDPKAFHLLLLLHPSFRGKKKEKKEKKKTTTSVPLRGLTPVMARSLNHNNSPHPRLVLTYFPSYKTALAPKASAAAPSCGAKANVQE